MRMPINMSVILIDSGTDQIETNSTAASKKYPTVCHIGNFHILRHFLHSPRSLYNAAAKQAPPTIRKIAMINPKLFIVIFSLTINKAETTKVAMKIISAVIESFNLCVYFIVLDFMALLPVLICLKKSTVVSKFNLLDQIRIILIKDYLPVHVE